MENRKQKLRTNCDSCTNYVYDEEYEYYVCEVNLDEDEMGLSCGEQWRIARITGRMTSMRL